MKTAEKNALLKWNTLLWLAAMVMPAFLHIALAGTKFPWPLILPFLLFGPMLGSNRMLSRASGEAADDADPKGPTV